MRCFLLAALVTAITIQAEARQPIPAPRVKGTKAKPDVELIQGNWHIVGLETGGKAEDQRNYRGNTFAFAKVKGMDTATLQEGKLDPIPFVYTLDPTANPKSIDLALPAKSVTFRGIYKLEGDDLTICVSNGGTRPTQFATKAGGDTELFALKRNQWERFVDRYGSSFEMPGKPDERERDIDTPAGMTTATLFVRHSEMERVTYVLSVARLPGKLEGKEIETATTAIKNVAVAAVYPNAIARQEEKKGGPKMAGVASQDISFSLEVPNMKDRAAARVRVIVLPDRIYALLVVGVEEAMKPDTPALFWNSFRQPMGKKGGKN